ncbi:MAG: menaquinone biosynthesis decarboxylase [Bacteroidales bacterium]|jgi:4-hydroxy-3-polyprenylbenzoate decarboxylase|nr:menaquinone biosynthesis decarboxylase [Bacteroidales bacterium]
MPFSGLSDFIDQLENKGELTRIRAFVDPVLEIAEITDRVSKNGGKALLFENTGTGFPLLINAFGSEKRMAMAMSRKDLDDAGLEIVTLFEKITGTQGNLFKKLSVLPDLNRISGILPARSGRKGICQQVIHRDPDLAIFPVLKCWPHDGGRFVTLPMVHTVHPVTGKTNVGMYRMQILDKNTTAMHWQRHKTGANHFEAWKKSGKRMPVSVTLGGDPVYTYAATAPLPENIDEYLLAGFLRNKKVRLVKCITNDIYVPFDADIVIEGFVDPAEEPVWEGPFGDHTGFYSLADWYPRFHVTCITHSERAVYPATIVGIPPMEDALLARASEKIFLAPIKLSMQPEVEDFHMPDAGIAHNLVIVKIDKTYPGQGKKVISSLFGAGQMMFTKYLLVVSGDIDIRNYRSLILHVLENTDFRQDLLFGEGPLDVLDHSSDTFSLGGKLGIDGTIKMEGEVIRKPGLNADISTGSYQNSNPSGQRNLNLLRDIQVAVVGLNQSENPLAVEKSKEWFRKEDFKGILRLILAVDHNADAFDMFTVAWQVLGNSDPKRDIDYISDNIIFIDGTIKAFREGGFPRRWPNIVRSSEETIKNTDQKWDSLEIGPFIPSPSLNHSLLSYAGNDEVMVP